jgi:E3 ubiquitin-protein ligase BRE1
VLLVDNERFKEHLARHRQEIIHTVTSLYQRIPPQNLTDSETQHALKSALAKNNALLADIGRITAEKDDRDDRLTNTMMRLLSLEKKLDRSKSITLAKIEAQATQKPTEEPQEQEVQENGNTPSRPSSRVNSRNTAELESLNATHRAALATLKEECAAVLKEKSAVLLQLSDMTTKMATPAREEIEGSQPYKALLSQIEHLSSEIARLESSSEKLREENTSLLAERTKFKEDIVAEHKVAMDEANSQIQRIEHDLTRVRGVRDELHFEIQNRKAKEDETLHSAREISEIADSREVSPLMYLLILDAYSSAGEGSCTIQSSGRSNPCATEFRIINHRTVAEN